MTNSNFIVHNLSRLSFDSPRHATIGVKPIGDNSGAITVMLY